MAEGNVVWIFRGAALASPFLAAILASFPWSTVVSFGLLAFVLLAFAAGALWLRLGAQGNMKTELGVLGVLLIVLALGFWMTAA
jgi:hypothetical protein